MLLVEFGSHGLMYYKDENRQTVEHRNISNFGE